MTHRVHCRCGEWVTPEHVTKRGRFGAAEECTKCWARRRAAETVALIPANIRRAVRKAFRQSPEIHNGPKQAVREAMYPHDPSRQVLLYAPKGRDVVGESTGLYRH